MFFHGRDSMLSLNAEGLQRFYNFIEYCFLHLITFVLYLFDVVIRGRHLTGFLFAHIPVFCFFSPESSFLMFFLTSILFFLFYRLFIPILILNSYAIMYMMSFTINEIPTDLLHHYQAHPFTLMLVLPLIYMVLFLIILPNKYTKKIYTENTFSHLELFQMLLINFMVTYAIAYIFIFGYKFLGVLLTFKADTVIPEIYVNGYDFWRIASRDELFCYTTLANNFGHPALFFVFYFDNLGILFMGLSLLLIFLCFLFLWPTFVNDNNKTLYINLLLLLLVQLQGTFTAGSLLGFFVFFESLLIPMLIMIVIWGSKNNRQASNYLVFYTMFSAIPMFLAIVYIIHKTNLYTIPDLYYYITSSSDIRKTWTWTEQLTLWLAFFLGFAVKTPMVPFHIWLPKAHVDAPTVGSVILAGLLLKVGLVGFIRILYLLFPVATKFFAPYVAAIATVGVIYASLITLRQIDMKRIIAYSSVAHMNMAMVSLCSLNAMGVYSSIYLMLSHGLIASGLFFLVGFLYNRFHVRSVYYYGGLATIMPVLGFFFFLFTLANMAFPLTSGFIGEFLLLLGISMNNFYIAFLNAFSMLFTTVYSVLLFGRVFLGELKPWFENMVQHHFKEKNNLPLNNLPLNNFLDFKNLEKMVDQPTPFDSLSFEDKPFINYVTPTRRPYRYDEFPSLFQQFCRGPNYVAPAHYKPTIYFTTADSLRKDLTFSDHVEGVVSNYASRVIYTYHFPQGPYSLVLRQTVFNFINKHLFAFFDILRLDKKIYPQNYKGLIKSVSIFDIYYYELIIVLTLFAGILFLGIYPQIIFKYLHFSMVLNETISSMLLPYPVDFYMSANLDLIKKITFFPIQTIFIKI